VRLFGSKFLEAANINQNDLESFSTGNLFHTFFPGRKGDAYGMPTALLTASCPWLHLVQ